MFFFSSRRRHTRWPRDWSSDVCSSDLLSVGKEGKRSPGWGLASASQACRSRSEERRVGKEGSGRGWRGEEQKKRRSRHEGGRGGWLADRSQGECGRGLGCGGWEEDGRG